MKTKLFPISLSSMILALLMAIGGCQREEVKPSTIRLTGIEFAPNCFLKNGEMAGIDVDIADTAMQMAGVDLVKDIAVSWDDAYSTTLAGPNRALLTVGYSAERKDLFKWAGPVSQGMYGIFAKGNQGLTFPLSIEASKEIGSIAVVRNWLETTTLENLGFQNLLYYDTYNAAISAFMNGEVFFIASDFFHLVAVLPPGYYLPEVNVVTRYRTVYYYVAFSKDVSDAVVEKVQNAVETLIEDKTTALIMKKYFPLMPSDYIPGTFQLFTEASPPYSYGTGHDTTRRVVGSSVDVVNEIQARNGYVNKINLTTWTDAYTHPQYLPNSAVFTTARTPSRESMFQWVGPICNFRAFFYTLSNSGIKIETLEQARALQSIATPKDWYTHDFLIQNNFTNIVATSVTSQQAFDQLINGTVEALLMTQEDVKWLADTKGVAMSDLAQHFEALNMDGYIAFSLSTPAKIVQEWQTSLDAMKTDGTFETIRRKWFGI